jgi:hypothetical protein
MEARRLLANIVVTNTAAQGPGSLFQALTISNNTPGFDSITFNIPGRGVHAITPPGGGFPIISDPVSVDATTQPGYAGQPLIAINSSPATGSASGLIITAGGTTVRGLAVSGYGGQGIVLSGRGGDNLQANFLGTDPTGTKPLGNGQAGVAIVNSNNNTIGGTTAAARNLISANFVAGVVIQGTSSGNLIEGNSIGTDIMGAQPLGNLGPGVRVGGSANTIGGFSPGAGNTIAFNNGSGIAVQAGALGNAILSNSVVANTTGGIALAPGANNNQAPPSLTSALLSPNGTTINGTLTGPPGTSFALQFFANVVADPSGFGQGQTQIGTVGVHTDAAGNAPFSVTFPTGVPVGQFISATATDPGGNTSQFSADQVVTGSPLSFTVINTNDSGPGSLRQAIRNANFVRGINTIDFKIPGTGPQVIHLLTPLPEITDPVIIDGFTQPGAVPNTQAGGDGARVLVQVDGSAAGVQTSGLVVDAGQSTIRGLAFDHFGGWGMVLQDVGGDTVQGVRLGTDASGTLPLGNGLDGVLIFGTAGNTIGGASPADRNIISANSADGVQIVGATALNNLVQGNLIGTDATGTRALGNQFAGVLINGAPANTIGGLVPGAGNVISGNSLPGVEILGASATHNLLQGNLIGTDTSGTRAIGNVNIGVLISNAPTNTIGGTAPGARNIISGNVAGGSPASPETPAETTGAGAVVILGSLAAGNLVQGNLLGTDITGTSALGNAYDGVSISGAPHNMIGGTAIGAGNVISGNRFVGVRIVGPDASGNVVQGNLIGTDASGTRSLGNGFDGVFLNGAPGNLIGGQFTGNVISGNRGSGVQAFGTQASGNVVQGNLIGTDASGTIGLGNSGDGVFLDGSPGNTVGGSSIGAGNIIARSGFSGIELSGRGTSASLVQGNLVGAVPGVAANLGNSGFGVLVQNSSGNTIGGTVATAANFIASNALGGIVIVLNGTPVLAPGTAGNFLQGNILMNNGTGPFQPGGPTTASAPQEAHVPGLSRSALARARTRHHG